MKRCLAALLLLCALLSLCACGAAAPETDGGGQLGYSNNRWIPENPTASSYAWTA